MWLSNFVMQTKVKGRKIVVDAPSDLPEGARVTVRVTRDLSAKEELRLMDEMQAKIVPGPSIPDEALRRENLYEDRL